MNFLRFLKSTSPKKLSSIHFKQDGDQLHEIFFHIKRLKVERKRPKKTTTLKIKSIINIFISENKIEKKLERSISEAYHYPHQ